LTATRVRTNFYFYLHYFCNVIVNNNWQRKLLKREIDNQVDYAESAFDSELNAYDDDDSVDLIVHSDDSSNPPPGLVEAVRAMCRKSAQQRAIDQPREPTVAAIGGNVQTTEHMIIARIPQKKNTN
jgi:hypothetical protein